MGRYLTIKEINNLREGTEIRYILGGIEEIRTLEISPLCGLIARSSYDSYMPLNEDTMSTYGYKIKSLI